MAIKKDALDDLLAGRDPKAVFSKDGLFDELKKALAKRVLNAELDDHLDNEAAEGLPEPAQRLFKEDGPDGDGQDRHPIPRDREGTFDPKLIQRYQRRFPGFDDKIVSMYARGMTVREIQGHLLEIYGLEVSPDLISAFWTVLETVAEWQDRPLETSYPLVFFDAIRVKIRNEGLVRNKAVYLALGVGADGTKDILGLCIETSEGAKFWLKVMNKLKARGVKDILIAVVDGLKGFPEAIEAVFPQAAVQTCIVHLIRNSLNFASWKDRKPIVAELRKIYRAADAEAGRRAPWRPSRTAHGAENMRQLPKSGGGNGSRSVPFFAFAPAVRKIIYTTNAIEALNAKLRRAVRARGHFPSDEAATKLIFLVLRQIVREWRMPASRMGRGQDTVRHHVRLTLRQDLMEIRPRAQDSGHSPEGRSKGQSTPTSTSLSRSQLFPSSVKVDLADQKAFIVGLP